MRSHSSQTTTGSWLADSLTRNPEGLLLVGAGLALLMRKAVASRPSDRASREHWRERSRNFDGRSEGNDRRDGNLTNTMRDAAKSASEYASDLSEKATDTVAGYASSVAGFADQASERTRDVARQAGSALQSSGQTILQNQPLAVAVAGLAVGAAVAAAFPPTDIERRNLGPAGERLKEAATKAGGQIKDAGLQAKEKFASVAEEHGLTAQGVKGMAQEVTDAFTDALSDDPASSPQKSWSPDSSAASSGRTAGASRDRTPDATRGKR